MTASALVIAWELGADDARRTEPEAVAIEHERTLEVVDRQRDDIDAGLHLLCLPKDQPGTTKSLTKETGVARCLDKTTPEVFSQLT
jgi:hypothetical protein